MCSHQQDAFPTLVEALLSSPPARASWLQSALRRWISVRLSKLVLAMDGAGEAELAEDAERIGESASASPSDSKPSG
eukprot:1490860-Amphidinium_carterae.1